MKSVRLLYLIAESNFEILHHQLLLPSPSLHLQSLTPNQFQLPSKKKEEMLCRSISRKAKPPGKVPVYLNVYDLTSANGYAYWLGLGAYHSGVQGPMLLLCFSWFFQLLVVFLVEPSFFFWFCFCYFWSPRSGIRIRSARPVVHRGVPSGAKALSGLHLQEIHSHWPDRSRTPSSPCIYGEAVPRLPWKHL